MPETFTILFYAPGKSRAYKATVEITYETANVIRFLISAGTKSLTMEKHIYRKSGQWKLTGMSMGQNSLPSPSHPQVLENISHCIDQYLKQRGKKPFEYNRKSW